MPQRDGPVRDQVDCGHAIGSCDHRHYLPAEVGAYTLALAVAVGHVVGDHAGQSRKEQENEEA